MDDEGWRCDLVQAKVGREITALVEGDAVQAQAHGHHGVQEVVDVGFSL